MNEVFRKQIEKSRDIFLDKSLVLLLVVGRTDENLISNCKRTEKFSPAAFRELNEVLKIARTVYTSPNILTEASNLSGQIPERLKPELFRRFHEVIQGFKEKYCRSSDVSGNPRFHEFGLTDISTMHLSGKKWLIISDDYKLVDFARSRVGCQDRPCCGRASTV